MSLTVNMPAKPSFIKDGIIVEVITTTTGVEAHYIVVDISVNNEIISAKQPVIEGKAIFNIAELINSKSDKIFDLSAELFSNSSNNIIWAIKASETYNFDNILHNTSGYYNSHSYRGSRGSYENNKFLTNYRKKNIHRSEFILLYFNFNTIIEGSRTAKIIFNDENNTELTYSINSTYSTQILLKPESIPITATQIIITIYNLSEEIIYQISDFNIIDKETFIYRNSYGVYDTISLLAHKEVKDNYSFETFRAINKEIKYNSLYQEETTKATYLLFNQFKNEKEVAFYLRELFLSEEVYLVAENYSTTPIVITDSKRPIYNTQDQMFSLEITYKKPFKNA